MTQVYDLSDPAEPLFIRISAWLGQQPGAHRPSAHRPARPDLDGPQGNRVYFGYGTSSGGILQIVDRDKLLEWTEGPDEPRTCSIRRSRARPAAFNGAHTTFPVLGVEVPEFAKDEKGKTRDFVVIVNESIRNECTEEARQMVFVVDVTDEAKPFPVANYQVRRGRAANSARAAGASAPMPRTRICTPIYYKRIMFFSWFNAGVRAVDIRDPYNPREIAYYIPATTEKTAHAA